MKPLLCIALKKRTLLVEGFYMVQLSSCVSLCIAMLLAWCYVVVCVPY